MISIAVLNLQPAVEHYTTGCVLESALGRECCVRRSRRVVSSATWPPRSGAGASPIARASTSTCSPRSTTGSTASAARRPAAGPCAASSRRSSACGLCERGDPPAVQAPRRPRRCDGVTPRGRRTASIGTAGQCLASPIHRSPGSSTVKARRSRSGVARGRDDSPCARSRRTTLDLASVPGRTSFARSTARMSTRTLRRGSSRRSARMCFATASGIARQTPVSERGCDASPVSPRPLYW